MAAGGHRAVTSLPGHDGVVQGGSEADASVAGFVILLIEDDLGDAVLVREYLADGDLGGRLQHVESLRQAQEFTGAPECILLDLHLPDAHGLDGLRQVLQRWPHAAVVVLTGLNDASTGSAAVAAGAQDYLVKDQVDESVLARTIRYAVQRKRVQTAERRLGDSRLQADENTRLQRGLLPKPLLDDTTVSVASRYLPGQQRSLLGGDFYDVVQTTDGIVHALIGDVCGNGPDEAALGVGLWYGWRTLTLAGLRKADRMRLLEQVFVAERPHSGLFATACTVGITPGRGEVILLSAGHPAPLVITADRAYPAEVSYGPGLGMAPGWPGGASRGSPCLPVRGCCCSPTASSRVSLGTALGSARNASSRSPAGWPPSTTRTSTSTPCWPTFSGSTRGATATTPPCCTCDGPRQ